MSFDFNHLKKLCVCSRSTKGFDYGEIHPRLGKCGIGQRWSSTQDNFELLEKKYNSLESELALLKSENEIMRECLCDFQNKTDIYLKIYAGDKELAKYKARASELLKIKQEVKA